MTTLTAAQIAALKTYLNTDPDGLGFAALIAVGDDTSITAKLNTASTYSIIRTDAPTLDIENAILWANYTPSAAISIANAQIAALYCQNKQINLQLLIQRPNQTAFDATRANNVAGLKDATTALPSKSDLTNQTGGWTQGTGQTTTVPMALCRLATFVEKLFATPNTTQVPQLFDGTSAAGTAPSTGGVGAPGLLTYQGPCNTDDVAAALK